MVRKFISILIIITFIVINITSNSYALNNIEANKNNYGLRNYEEMVTTLKKIENNSKHVTLETIGKSVQGRSIYLVRFGVYNSKNPTILILTQQHGNEGVPTESAINFIKKLSINNKKNINLINKVNILVLPRLNVDGAEGSDGIPTRLNINQVDLNRDHFSKSQPETQALHYNVLSKYKIDYMIDFHQKSSKGIAMLYPTNQCVKPDVLIKSKKLGGIVYKTLRNNDWGELSEYHGGSKNIIARNEVACEYGVATLLVEMDKMIDYNDEKVVFNKKQHKKLIKEGECVMLEVVNSIANKDIDKVNISIWNKLCEKILHYTL